MSNPAIKLYRSDTIVEIGTVGNPIDTGFCAGGTVTDLAYDILMYNDKDGTSSEDAYDMSIELLRLYETTQGTSTGAADQTLTAAHIPLLTDIEEEVTVDGVQWSKVDNFTGVVATEEAYTFNYTTGVVTFGNDVNGKAPTVGAILSVKGTPDLNTYGKELYDEQWVSFRSSGVIQNNINVTLGLSTKLTDDSIQVLHYPEIVSVAGVYDNAGGTGTDYYSGGSFNATTGVLTLGTSLTDPNPYVTYVYRVKNDDQPTYTPLGDGDELELDYRLPRNNAKRIQMRIEPPVSASTEGGSYLQFYLRVKYKY